MFIYDSSKELSVLTQPRKERDIDLLPAEEREPVRRPPGYEAFPAVWDKIRRVSPWGAWRAGNIIAKSSLQRVTSTI